MTTQVQVQPSRVKRTNWKDWGVRFLLGGAISVAAGLISSSFGPVVGGLFLAFPAILPASVTLIAEHEDSEKAGIDAFGAAMGCAGLLAFGAVVWLLGTRLSAWEVLLLATLAWFIVSTALWLIVRVVRT